MAEASAIAVGEEPRDRVHRDAARCAARACQHRRRDGRHGAVADARAPDPAERPARSRPAARRCRCRCGPPDQIVNGVVIPIESDLNAVVLLLIPLDDAQTLCAMLGVEAGTEIAIRRSRRSATCSAPPTWMCSLAMTGFSMDLRPPELVTDMLASIVASLLAATAGYSDTALMLDTRSRPHDRALRALVPADPARGLDAQPARAARARRGLGGASRGSERLAGAWDKSNNSCCLSPKDARWRARVPATSRTPCAHRCARAPRARRGRCRRAASRGRAGRA